MGPSGVALGLSEMGTRAVGWSRLVVAGARSCGRLGDGYVVGWSVSCLGWLDATLRLVLPLGRKIKVRDTWGSSKPKKYKCDFFIDGGQGVTWPSAALAPKLSVSTL